MGYAASDGTERTATADAGIRSIGPELLVVVVGVATRKRHFGGRLPVGGRRRWSAESTSPQSRLPARDSGS
jgi:hypothetical protein